jgi:hypothetical protein
MIELNVTLSYTLFDGGRSKATTIQPVDLIRS